MRPWMDVRAAELARAHDGLIAWNRLIEAGMPERAATRAVAGLRQIHDGVFLTGHGRLTDHQRRLAATLTAPETALSHASAGAHDGFFPSATGFEVVTRPGSGGPRRIGDLLVCRSLTLNGWVTVRDGIPLTKPARTIIDLAPHLSERRRAKAVREAIRLKVMTALELRLALAEHRGRRGIAGLAELAARLERLPIGRTRSDAEARALEVLDAAGVAPPDVNRVIEGEEADLSWPVLRRIVEIDGPQFHQDPVEDARKERAWRARGWTVDRISSDAVFHAPERLVALARDPERPWTDATASVPGRSVEAVGSRRRRGASAPPRGTAAS